MVTTHHEKEVLFERDRHKALSAVKDIHPVELRARKAKALAMKLAGRYNDKELAAVLLLSASQWYGEAAKAIGEHTSQDALELKAHYLEQQESCAAMRDIFASAAALGVKFNRAHSASLFGDSRFSIPSDQEEHSQAELLRTLRM